MKMRFVLGLSPVSEKSLVKEEQSLSMRDIYRRYCITGESPAVRSSGLQSVNPDSPIPAFGDVSEGLSGILNQSSKVDVQESSKVVSVETQKEDLPE